MSCLYTPEGWLNFDYIISRPAWLITIIGKRQVGKTYGALRAMLDHDLKHVLLRRTTAELETISAAPDLNPYKVFEPEYYVGLFKAGKRICRICDYDTDEEGRAVPFLQNPRGIAMSLAEIAHIRGFNGSAFSDLIYDEFIPEKGVITRKTEGDSFLNAYTTINGNRELKGLPPLRAWLLANTNNINSPVLETLNLTDKVLQMRRRGKEELLENGVYIIQPNSAKISAARSETALMRQVSRDGEFYKMAQENEFSYDLDPHIKTLSIKGMSPLWSYADTLYCWESSSGLYICRAPFKGGRRYPGTRSGREKLAMDNSFMKPYFFADLVFFSDMRMIALFKSIFGIDK